MLYADHRHKIKSGDLIAFRASSFWGWLISLWTLSPYSHVGVAWRFRERVFLLEAKEGRGVQIRALSQCLPFDHVPTDAFWDDHIETDAMMFLGKPYAWLDLAYVGIGLEPMAEGLICSEYAAKMIRPNVQEIWQKIPKSPTPANLVRFFQKHNGPAVTVRPS